MNSFMEKLEGILNKYLMPVADNLNKQTDLILSYEDTEDMVVYDKLIRNTNKTIILNLYKENGKLVVKTKIEDIKVKPTEFGSLIGKFYNIIIARRMCHDWNHMWRKGKRKNKSITG